jgi:hypothetical protein
MTQAALDDEHVRPAATHHNDWVGTAAMDGHNGGDPLHRVLGVDPARWWVLSVELYMGASGSWRARAFIGDRHELDHPERLATMDDIPVLSVDYGPEDLGLSLEQFIGRAFKRCDLVCRWSATGDAPLHVTEHVRPGDPRIAVPAVDLVGAEAVSA